MKSILICFLSVIVSTIIGCGLEPKKPESITITAPELKSPKVEILDSSFLKLKVIGNSFEVDFLNKHLVLDEVSKLDAYFEANAKLIDKEKIQIIGLDTTKTNKDLIKMLTKYGVTRFRSN